MCKKFRLLYGPFVSCNKDILQMAVLKRRKAPQNHSSLSNGHKAEMQNCNNSNLIGSLGLQLNFIVKEINQMTAIK